jgi:hypothetical protein
MNNRNDCNYISTTYEELGIMTEEIDWQNVMVKFLFLLRDSHTSTFRKDTD